MWPKLPTFFLLFIAVIYNSTYHRGMSLRLWLVKDLPFHRWGPYLAPKKSKASAFQLTSSRPSSRHVSRWHADHFGPRWVFIWWIAFHVFHVFLNTMFFLLKQIQNLWNSATSKWKKNMFQVQLLTLESRVSTWSLWFYIIKLNAIWKVWFSFKISSMCSWTPPPCSLSQTT